MVEHQTRFIFDVCDAVTVLAAGELRQGRENAAEGPRPATASGRCTISAYERPELALDVRGLSGWLRPF